MSAHREKVRFASGGTECAAWHYPGTSGTCIVMAGGFAVPKEPATDLFARRFQEAGFGVLAFDYRGLGESGGEPRQVMRYRDQVADWEAAIAFARTLPGVDPDRIAIWGFSMSGAYVVEAAARDPRLAAAIAQTPITDGFAALRAASRYQTARASLRLFGRGIADAVGGLFGRRPLLVPLGGEPGTVALLTTPDAADGPRALAPADPAHAGWLQAVAARSTLTIGFRRPGRAAARVACPLLVLVCDGDQSALPGPAVRDVSRAPRGELVRLTGRHYSPFLEVHEQAVAVEVEFLRRHLGEQSKTGAVRGLSVVPAEESR